MKPAPTQERTSILQSLRQFFGFYRNPQYIEDRLKEADTRSALFLSAVVAMVEIWMIIRYIVKYVFLEAKCDSIGEFFQYTKAFWLLFLASALLCLYSALYLKKKLVWLKPMSRIFIFSYFALAMYFGVATSLSDFSRGRMITCFLTILMYTTVICIWRPITSILLTFTCSAGFIYLIQNYSFDKEGNPISMHSADLVNFITFIIVLVILELAVYFDRYNDATKSYKLKMRTITDDLTGIPNMHKFEKDVKSYFTSMTEQDKKPIFLVFDIVNFHTFNDRFGYAGGDDLLIRMAQEIVSAFPDEPAARESGDCFCVLTAADDYQQRAANIRKWITNAYPEETYLTLRVGAFRMDDEKKDPRHAVDRARYALKRIRDNDTFLSEYDEKMSKDYILKQYVLNNLETAIAKGYIKVFYQPVMWADDGTICGCEALARWIDPDMGFMSPGVFIPVLEEGRRIHKLDLCIYEQVCKRIRDCLDQGLPALPTSINFSRLDFELMDAVSELEALVQKYQIPKEYLHVEITESAVTKDVEGLKKAMDRLHNSGYVIWLDDFGAGYSSLNVLKDFRFDLLKIDMEFLKGFSENENAQKIVETIIELAEKLNMKTLTEGVEEQEAVDFLRRAGCGRLQGYFYGKPMPYEDILAKIEDGTYRIRTVSALKIPARQEQ